MKLVFFNNTPISSILTKMIRIHVRASSAFYRAKGTFLFQHVYYQYLFLLYISLNVIHTINSKKRKLKQTQHNQYVLLQIIYCFLYINQFKINNDSNKIWLFQKITYMNENNQSNLINTKDNLQFQEKDYEGEQQQQELYLQTLVNTFRQPDVKDLQKHNPNHIERQLLDIAQNFYAFIEKLQILKGVCIDYLNTLKNQQREEQLRGGLLKCLIQMVIGSGRSVKTQPKISFKGQQLENFVQSVKFCILHIKQNIQTTSKNAMQAQSNSILNRQQALKQSEEDQNHNNQANFSQTEPQFVLLFILHSQTLQYQQQIQIKLSQFKSTFDIERIFAQRQNQNNNQNAIISTFQLISSQSPQNFTLKIDLIRLTDMQLIIHQTKSLQTSQHAIKQSINKLKVMILKVKAKQSSSFDHIYSTYISKLTYVLKHSNMQEKSFKMQKIKKITDYIYKKYMILNLKSKYVYVYHRTRYPQNIIGIQYIAGDQHQENNGNALFSVVNEMPMFFICFFNQQLLFLRNLPIKLPRNQLIFSELLFCPIILGQQSKTKSLIYSNKPQSKSIQISPWYINRLCEISPLWESSVLLINIYHDATSQYIPIFYSHFTFKPFQMPKDINMDGFFTQNQQDIPFSSNMNFLNYDMANEEKLIKNLENIQTYLYQVLIFNHLSHFLNKKHESPQIKHNKINSINSNHNQKIKINGVETKNQDPLNKNHKTNGQIKLEKNQILEILITGGFRIEFQMVENFEKKQQLLRKLKQQRNTKKDKHLNNKSERRNSFESSERDSKFSNGNNNKAIESIYYPQFFTELLFFYKQKNICQKNPLSLKQELGIAMKNLLFKITTEILNQRVQSPAYPGSMGFYYYKYKAYRKSSVKDFLEIFQEDSYVQTDKNK